MSPASIPVRVVLPAHLRNLSRQTGEVTVQVPAPATIAGVLDALEAAYPMLSGTLRDQQTRRRRPFVRFFACGEDLSHLAPETLLPAPVAAADEPFLIVGAVAGGARP